METGRFDTSRGDRLNNPDRIKELRPVQLLKDVAGIRKGMTCVDLGAGTGIFAFPMSEIVGIDGTVYAVDKSDRMLDLIRKKNPPVNLKLLQSDAAETGLDDESVDVCLGVLILHEVDYPGRIIAEVNRVLKPLGRVVIVEWKMEVRWGPPRSVRLSKEAIERLFDDTGIDFVEYIDWSPTYCVISGKKPLPQSA